MPVAKRQEVDDNYNVRNDDIFSNYGEKDVPYDLNYLNGNEENGFFEMQKEAVLKSTEIKMIEKNARKETAACLSDEERDGNRKGTVSVSVSEDGKEEEEYSLTKADSNISTQDSEDLLKDKKSGESLNTQVEDVHGEKTEEDNKRRMEMPQRNINSPQNGQAKNEKIVALSLDQLNDLITSRVHETILSMNGEMAEVDSSKNNIEACIDIEKLREILYLDWARTGVPDSAVYFINPISGRYWIQAVCQNPEYKNYGKALAIIKKSMKIIEPHLRDCNVLLDIGTGDGEKGAVIAEVLGERITIWGGADVSADLLVCSAQKIKNLNPKIARYPKVVDFAKINEKLIPSIRKNGNKILALFLGNTIGNCKDPNEIFGTLRENLRPGKDRLLFENHIIDNPDKQAIEEMKKGYNHEIFYKFAVLPLIDAGIDINKVNILPIEFGEESPDHPGVYPLIIRYEFKPDTIKEDRMVVFNGKPVLNDTGNPIFLQEKGILHLTNKFTKEGIKRQFKTHCLDVLEEDYSDDDSIGVYLLERKLPYNGGGKVQGGEPRKEY